MMECPGAGCHDRISTSPSKRGRTTAIKDGRTVSSPNRGLDLLGELQRRFSLLDRIVGQFGEETGRERIPWFFGLLLAAALKRCPGACCFVLDKTTGTAAATAVLLALVRLQEEFPELAREYSQNALSRGQQVKVKPSNYVYEYEGIWEGHPEFFRLKVLGEKAYRTIAITEVLRVEPTDRVRPKGYLGSNLGEFKYNRLDELLALATGGNNSLFRNSVLLYTPQARFSEFLSTISFEPKLVSGFDRLSTFFPWGSVGRSGALRPNDTYQVVGEPLVAVTNVAEDLAAASLSAPTGTKAVIVDGARGLARDLQAFDDLADKQMVVIIASPEESRDLDLLEDRGCPIWHMSPDEILIGEDPAKPRERSGMVGATIRAAETRQRATTTTVDCRDDVIQAVAESLERAAAVIEANEEAVESKEILVRVFGILFECSECCFGVGKETKDNLRDVRDQIAKQWSWLEPSFARDLQTAIDRLEEAIESESFGDAKATALLEILLGEDPDQWVVATRLPRTAETLRAGLEGVGLGACVSPIAAITRSREHAGIVVTTWPNKQRFSRLQNLSVAPDLRILAYPFERKWILSHQANEHIRSRRRRPAAAVRASILGINPIVLNEAGSPSPNRPILQPPPEPIFRVVSQVAQRRKRPPVADDGEDSREAQMVQFFGGCHALMTEWAELPRLNHLIDTATTGGGKLENVRVSQLSPGDVVLFREAGDKEFTRLIAEEILGSTRYERTRRVAELWRSSLRDLGSSPAEVQQRLVAHGLKRTTQTVAGWLGDPDRIGPGDSDDIVVIAKATGDSSLLLKKTEVENAIAEVRGAHISAGRRLTELILGELSGRLGQLGDQPLLLDLDYGAAWVVQVETLDSARRLFPSRSVNRLLWVDDTGQ